MNQCATTVQVIAGTRPTRKRFVLLATLLIGIAVAYFDRINVSVLGANAQFLNDMGIADSPTKIGLLMSAFLAAYGIGNILLSPLGDILGPRKSMLICFVVMAASMLVGGLAPTFGVMICARILLGIGEGYYYPLQGQFTKNWFPKQERGRATSVWVVGQSLAPALAMPLFTFVIGNFGWHFSFFMCIAFGLIPMYMVLFHVSDTPQQHKSINKLELDHILSGLDKQQDAKKTAGITLKQRLLAFAKDRQYWTLVLFYICLQCIGWGLMTWIPNYLKMARHFSWTEMGILSSLPYIFSVCLKASTGFIVDKFGKSSPVLLFGMGICAVCAYCGAIVENNYVSAFFLACALGFGTMTTPAAWTLLQSIIPSTSMATAGGCMNGISNIIASASPVLIGYFISHGGYEGGLFFIAGVAAFACIPSLLLSMRKV